MPSFITDHALLLHEDRLQTVSFLKSKYPDFINAIDSIGKMAEVPEQAMEWIIHSISMGSGIWPEDKTRFINEWESYNGNKGNQKYLDVLRPTNPNVKNPLNYSLHDLEAATDAISPQPSKRELKKTAKQEGSKLLYDVPPYKVIQIGGEDVDIDQAAQAACYYAANTKWCTSDPETAVEYLEKSPLFIIIKDGQAIAQYHPAEGQLMDEKDRPIEDTKTMRKLLNAAGVEEMVKKDPEWAYEYARDIIDGRWQEGEEAIKKSSQLAYQYARYTIKGRWPEGERIIKKDARLAYYYALDVIKGRWPEGEEAIRKDPEWASHYARDVIKERWPEGEEAIKEDPEWAYEYARDVIKRRWPEGERIIKKDARLAYYYALDVIKGRWPEAEEVIKKDQKWAYNYAHNIEQS